MLLEDGNGYHSISHGWATENPHDWEAIIAPALRRLFVDSRLGLATKIPTCDQPDRSAESPCMIPHSVTPPHAGNQSEGRPGVLSPNGGVIAQRPPVSALGHKRTYAVHKPMSALGQKWIIALQSASQKRTLLACRRVSTADRPSLVAD
jgi:hypothetical protein